MKVAYDSHTMDVQVEDVMYDPLKNAVVIQADYVVIEISWTEWLAIKSKVRDTT